MTIHSLGESSTPADTQMMVGTPPPKKAINSFYELMVAPGMYATKAIMGDHLNFGAIYWVYGISAAFWLGLGYLIFFQKGNK